MKFAQYVDPHTKTRTHQALTRARTQLVKLLKKGCLSTAMGSRLSNLTGFISPPPPQSFPHDFRLSKRCHVFRGITNGGVISGASGGV